MKLITILVAVFALAACAEENEGDRVVQLCGAELARAVKRVCVDGDVGFFNSQQVEHNHQHSHDHNHDSHSKNHAAKRDYTPSITDMCCSKPCHVKDFVSYCPQH